MSKTITKTKKVKKKKTSEQKAREKLWELCKKIIRKKYGNFCYTCGKGPLAGSSWHTGHFIPSATGGALLRYNLNNLRPQCYYCNINLGGNGSAFYYNLVLREGQEYVDNLFLEKQKSVKADLQFYEDLIERYTHLAN